MGEENEVLVSVKEGDIFHYNNSFKYNPGLFEDCAQDAGLDVIACWEGLGDVRLYLFHVSPIEARQVYNAPKKFSCCALDVADLCPAGYLAMMQERIQTAA